MALTNPSYRAEANIRPARFVKFGSNPHQIVECDGTANEVIIGISHNGTREAPIPGVTPYCALAGESCWIHGLGAQGEVTAGAAFSAGALLASDAQGRAIAATAGVEAGAIAQDDVTAADQMAMAQVRSGDVGT